jgi:hypothetical protein
MELTYVEAMLIAAVHVVMSCFTLKSKGGKGQLGYSGHCVALPRDTARLVNALPMMPADLETVVVRPADADDEELARRPEFTVRPHVIEQTLAVLRLTHPTYQREGLISDDNMRELQGLCDVDSDRFSAYALLKKLDADEVPDEAPPAVRSGPAQDLDEAAAAEALDAFSDSVILNLGVDKRSEEEAIRHAISDAAAAGDAMDLDQAVVLPQPNVGRQAYSEHDAASRILTDGWPHLFPEGVGDLLDQRDVEIPAADLLKHLLREKSGRFARDSRLRYYLFNRASRGQSQRLASFYGHRNPADAELTVGDLRKLGKDGLKALANRVYRMSSTLRGTPMYWRTAGGKLFAMIRVLGSPSLFYTATAADLQWRDLHGFLRRLENPLAAEPAEDARPSEEERQRRNRIALTENPAAVAWYVNKRWQRFFSTVLRPFFRLVDHWHRAEWQDRGSGHWHGLGWPEGAPDLSSMPEDLREAAVCEFWGPMLSAINPDIDRPRAIPHPSSVPWDERDPTNARLAELLNCFQRHAKHTDYCLRKPKKQVEKVRCASWRDTYSIQVCRFGLPREPPFADTPVVSVKDGRASFEPLRNDGAIVPYSPCCTMSWTANMAMIAATDDDSFANYVSKCVALVAARLTLARYAAKQESAGKSVADLFTVVLRKPLEDDSGAALVIRKVMSQLLLERDFSAQEVCHQALGEPLMECSRQFRSLDLRVDADQPLDLEKLDDADDDEPATKSTLLQRWRTRPPACLPGLSLYDVRLRCSGPG